MRRVVVTGGAGFIGSHVVEKLIAADCFVIIVDNFRTGQQSNLRRLKQGSFELIDDSVLQITAYEDRLRDCETIFHLAAEVGNINSIEHPAADACTNVLGTIAVCELARRTNAKIVYSSSSAVYGEPLALPIGEDHRMTPLSPYGLSKLTGELYIRLYRQLHGVRYVSLRYFNVYGQGQPSDPYSSVIPIFVRRVLNDEELVVFGDGLQTRDFVHVRDVAEANWLADQANISAGVYNVGTSTRSSLLDLLAILRGLQPRIRWRFEAWRAGEVTHSVADITRIKRDLRFTPSISLAEGVADFYDSSSAERH